MHDPLLTPLGETQCAALAASFPYTPLITHLVASPLRRTLYTCLQSFPSLVAPPKNLKIVALAEIQETSDLPCDTGSDVALLEAEFGKGQWKGTVDLARVPAGWNDKGPDSRWSPTPANLETRAAEARKFLQDLGAKHVKETGEDAHIVVVTHGGLLHFLTEDWTGFAKKLGTGWENTEWRSYTFREGEAASMEETEPSKARRAGKEIPLTADEERELRASGEGEGELWSKEENKGDKL